jgi:hypothetical protein
MLSLDFFVPDNGCDEIARAAGPLHNFPVRGFEKNFFITQGLHYLPKKYWYNILFTWNLNGTIAAA